MATKKPTTEGNPKKRSRAFLIVLIILVAAGAAFGISKYIHSLHHEGTDNAQVEQNINPVIPKISGFITEVRVRDNQPVRKGDTLFLLDDRDLQLKVEEAEAALASAKNNLLAAKASTTAARANIGTSAASIKTVDAQIETAKVNVWRATQDYQRYENLIKDHSITLQQYEQAKAAKQTAEKELQVLQEQRNQAARQTAAVSSQSNATAVQINLANSTIRQREVDVENAKLNLSYATVTAPADGIASTVNAQAGQFIQAGQATFSIVQDNEIWVVANFKETQFNNLREGQRAIISVDALGGHEFEGKLASFSPATGSRFALLPPDNASGNFVKVVQRLPVRIEFTNPKDPLVSQLKAGMNVVVDVHLD